MPSTTDRPTIPVEHVKSTEELIREVDLHAAFIIKEVKRRGLLKLTIENEEAVELASTLFQLTSLVRSKENMS